MPDRFIIGKVNNNTTIISNDFLRGKNNHSFVIWKVRKGDKINTSIFGIMCSKTSRVRVSFNSIKFMGSYFHSIRSYKVLNSMQYLLWKHTVWLKKDFWTKYFIAKITFELLFLYSCLVIVISHSMVGTINKQFHKVISEYLQIPQISYYSMKCNRLRNLNVPTDHIYFTIHLEKELSICLINRDKKFTLEMTISFHLHWLWKNHVFL